MTISEEEIIKQDGINAIKQSVHAIKESFIDSAAEAHRIVHSENPFITILTDIINGISAILKL